MSPHWPKRGRCGACTRPATAFPSGRWEHDGRPCALRSQSVFRAYDIDARKLLVFVPDGEDLPQPTEWQRVVRYAGQPNVPAVVELHPPDAVRSAWDEVRERLRADAEQDQPDPT